MRTARTTAVVALAVLAVLVAAMSPASASGGPAAVRPLDTNIGARLSTGDTLANVTFRTLHSGNGLYRAYTHGQTCALTVDANSGGWRLKWRAPAAIDTTSMCRTSFTPSGFFGPDAYTKMQNDGNLVTYAYDYDASRWRAVWSSGTWACGDGSTLLMQNDGNLVVYRRDGRATWSVLTGRTGIC